GSGLGNTGGFLVRERLPPGHRDLNVARLHLHGVADAAGSLGRDELGAGATEGLVADVARLCMKLDGADEQLDRLLGRVDAGLLAHLIDVPDGALASGRLQLRRGSFNPTVEARLMAPRVVRAGQHA